MTPLEWVFQHWSPRNVTSRHKYCLTKRAVGNRAVRKKAGKYSLVWKRPPLGTSGKLVLIGKRKLARQLLDREQRERNCRGRLSLVAGRRLNYRATNGVAVVVETGVPTYRPWRL